jgi:hypothetical protein
MRRIIVLAIVVLALAGGTGLWLKATAPAVGSTTPNAISTNALHGNTDAGKLTDTTVAQPY